MTNQDIYALLLNVDHGYSLIEEEYELLFHVTSITWSNIRELPKSLRFMKNVSNLDLRGTRVSDISALSGLTSLTELNLRETEARDIRDLSGLTALTTLDLRGTKVSDISTLSSLTALTKLDLSNNFDLSDISALSRLTELTDLDLSETNISEISALSGLTGLINLDLSYTNVSDISALSGLTRLTNLNLRRTRVGDISALSGLTRLTKLDLSSTKVGDISALSNLMVLTKLDLRSPNVSDISALSGLTSLRYLNLSYCGNITDISSLRDLINLENLDLRGTKVSDASALSGLTELIELGLGDTDVSDISPLLGLKRLINLDLSNLTLNVIPEWVIDLNLVFLTEQDFRYGIHIRGLQLIEQPIEIFSQDRELIRAYYRYHGKVPINECKVIFLGDAESGKTYSIKRLIQKGEKLADFDGNSTPGIEMTISSTKIESTNIVVNYWDFGGQEIQHSMHRMFLTQRTVYVVFLNARQDYPLDDRARYWIENIKSFAPSAPILLVINKIDQNNQPKFNEDGIRDEYKDQIKDVVRMSALKDEPEIFMKELQGNINKIIKELPTASTMVPKAWKSLMEDLRSSSKFYLTTYEFKEKCEAYNVKDYDIIHNSLVNLFQDIGVSFCYYKDRSIADYMLLNPKWLVNALYTIVTNSKDITQNGIIQQADLYDVLKKNYIKGRLIRRVVPKWRYEGIQVNYILGVIRMFRLSYQLKDGSEFFPMLCDGNEKISVNKAVSPNALHYIFKYTYLPANVLHRLIVEKQRELDYNYVWYSGAVFRNEAQAQIAYVHTIGNSLHIYVDCNSSFYNPNEYLTPILNEVRGINQDIGLQAEELIGLQINGKKAEIQVDLLIGNLSNGIERTFISKEIGVVDIRQILFRYNDNRRKGDEKLFNTIIASLAEMQNEKNFYNTDENSRNRFVSQQLRGAEYYCGDQVPGGLSATGKSIGARDGVIKDKNQHDISIFEGLNLDSLVKPIINSHLDRLLINYNPQGLPNGFMLVYLNCTRDNYKAFIARYIDYIKDYAPESYTCISSPSITQSPSNGQFLTCIKMDYECGGYYYTIYHIVVRIAA